MNQKQQMKRTGTLEEIYIHICKKPKHKTNITEGTIDTSPARLLTHFAAGTVQADAEKAKDTAEPLYYSLFGSRRVESD